MEKILFVAIAFLVQLSIIYSQADQANPPILQGPYLGQTPPGAVADIFAPGFVSTGLEESVITFMPDGRECYWSILLSGFETILTSRLENDKWSEPQVAPFAGKYYDGWPAVQPDGKRMFFHSSRPRPTGNPGITAKYNIWYMDRTGNGWSELINLGKEINSIMCAGASSFSADGKHFFFQARVPTKNTLALERKNSLKELLDNEIRNPAKGSADIYWIDAEIIEALKPGRTSK